MGKTVLSGVAILFVAVSVTYLAAVQTDGPEEVVAGLQRAASAGDVEGYLSKLTSESRRIVESSNAEGSSLREAHAEFEKALDEKFGAGTATIPDAGGQDDLKTAVSRIVGAEVVSEREAEDGSVELKLRTTVRVDGAEPTTFEEVVGARKENGAWKLSLGFPATRLDTLRYERDIERTTAEVRADKYEDRVVAMIALDNALRRKEVE